MALLPAGEAGKLLQWYDTGGGVYALRNRSMDDLFDEIASTAPTANKYYLDISRVQTAAAAAAFAGTGSIATLSISGQCRTSASAFSGTGSIAAASASSGAGASTSAAAVAGTGELASVVATGGAVANGEAASGTGALAAVTVTGTGSVTRTIVSVGYSGIRSYWTTDITGTWTRNTSPSNLGTALLTSSSANATRQIAYSPSLGLFVMLVGYAATGTYYTSPDGKSWTTRTSLPSSQKWVAVTWNGTAFCAVAYNAAKDTVSAYSTDGLTWTPSTLPASDYWYGVVSVGSRIIAYPTSSSQLAYSIDNGATWTLVTGLWTGGYVRDMATDGTRLVAVGSSGKIWYSTDGGLTWPAGGSAGAGTFNAVEYNGTVFCAVNGTTTNYTSSDGATWAPYTGTASLNWVARSGSTLLGVLTASGTSYYTSADNGQTWTARNTPETLSCLPVFGST